MAYAASIEICVDGDFRIVSVLSKEIFIILDKEVNHHDDSERITILKINSLRRMGRILSLSNFSSDFLTYQYNLWIPQLDKCRSYKI